MGNWLHTKVIKAYWSRHLLSILRPTSFILVLRRDAAGVPALSAKSSSVASLLRATRNFYISARVVGG